MKKIIKKTILLLITLPMIFSLNFAFAQENKPAQLPNQFRPQYAVDIKSPNNKEAGAGFVNLFLQTAAGALLTVAAPVAVIIIALAGLFATASRGDTNLQAKAKKTITGAVTGLVIIIFSWVIIEAIINFALQRTQDINSSNPQSQTQQTQTTPETREGTSGGGA